MTRADYIAAKIEFARHWIYEAWEQNAGPNGLAMCSGCRCFGPVVYASMLQWCEDCYPLAAPCSEDTQSKVWSERRAAQERDYGWGSATEKTGSA